MFDYLIKGPHSYNYEYYRGEDEPVLEDECDELAVLTHRQWRIVELDDEANPFYME